MGEDKVSKHIKSHLWTTSSVGPATLPAHENLQSTYALSTPAIETASSQEPSGPDCSEVQCRWRVNAAAIWTKRIGSFP